MPSNAIQKWLVHYYGFRKPNGAWSGPNGHGPAFYTVEARGHRDAKQKFRAYVLASTGAPAPKGGVVYTRPKYGATGERRRQIL